MARTNDVEQLSGWLVWTKYGREPRASVFRGGGGFGVGVGALIGVTGAVFTVFPKLGDAIEQASVECDV